MDNGESVHNNRATFRQAKEARIIVERVDYILNDHQAALTAAKFFYHPELFEKSYYYFHRRYYERNLFTPFPIRTSDIK